MESRAMQRESKQRAAVTTGECPRLIPVGWRGVALRIVDGPSSISRFFACPVVGEGAALSIMPSLSLPIPANNAKRRRRDTKTS